MEELKNRYQKLLDALENIDLVLQLYQESERSSDSIFVRFDREDVIENMRNSVGIAAGDIVCDGPYRQMKTASQKGFQVDYLVQTLTKNLFVCEFKFKRRELGIDIIESVRKKVNALKIPRGFAAVPVLFHVGGVAPSVETNGYFYRVIDITDFL